MCEPKQAISWHVRICGSALCPCSCRIQSICSEREILSFFSDFFFFFWSVEWRLDASHSVFEGLYRLFDLNTGRRVNVIWIYRNVYYFSRHRHIAHEIVITWRGKQMREFAYSDHILSPKNTHTHTPNYEWRSTFNGDSGGNGRLFHFNFSIAIRRSTLCPAHTKQAIRSPYKLHSKNEQYFTKPAHSTHTHTW